MTRTLVDMTPDERADCVGMWAERKRRLVVITDVSESVRTADWCCPATGSSGWDGWVELAPRFDLLRAWPPSGEPVPGEWEERTNQDGIGDYIRFTRQRRYITDWEVAP